MYSPIGVRMKAHEMSPTTPKGVNIIRVDGKAFHTWTKQIGAFKPFDSLVHDCMISATEAVAAQMQGFCLAYTQSDESTFMMENLGEKSEAWFGGREHKLNSVVASIFTYHFNRRYSFFVDTFNCPNIPAYFDARAHSIPVDDAANNFVWRQQDWRRNSIQMIGQHYLTHSEMQHLNNDQVIEYLREARDIDYNLVTGWERYGTFVHKVEGDMKFGHTSEYLNYQQVMDLSGLAQYQEENVDAAN